MKIKLGLAIVMLSMVGTAQAYKPYARITLINETDTKLGVYNPHFGNHLSNIRERETQQMSAPTSGLIIVNEGNHESTGIKNLNDGDVYKITITHGFVHAEKQ